MTEQITIKLNYKLFRPLMDKLVMFGGNGITESDSDLVGKALFFTHFFVHHRFPERGNKTDYEMLSEMVGKEKSEMLLTFLGEYHKFKKEGIAKDKEKKNNGK